MILEELRQRGIKVTLIDNNHIEIEPEEKVTKDILLRLKAEKSKIIPFLKQRCPEPPPPSFTCPICGNKKYKWNVSKDVWVCESCGMLFKHAKDSDSDIKELSRYLEELLKQHRGYVLVKSEVLNETIAWTLPAYIKHLQNKGYICYLPEELACIRQLAPTPDAFRKIHMAKKMFESKITIQ